MYTRSLVLVAVIGFSGSVGPEAAADDVQAFRTPGECWWPRLEMVLAVASGSPRPTGDFGAAVGFLEVNTGIKSGLDMTFVGYSLDQHRLRRSMRRWVDWFTERYPYLYWDPGRGVFRVDMQAQDAGVATERQRAPDDGKCDPKPLGCDEVFGPEAPLCELLHRSP